MVHGSDSSGRSAERLLREYLQRLKAGESCDFEQFTHQHPDDAERLRGLFDAFRRVEDLLREVPAHSENTVYTSGDSAKDEAWKKVIEQLKSRGPAHTRYIFEGEVAQGGMGVIHQVYDQDVRRHLAMKVILGEGGRGGARMKGDTPDVDSRSLGRFLEEAQVTGQLDHPGIVPVHEIGVDESDRVYFTMKLVKGEELRSVIDRVHNPNDDDWNSTRALSLILRVCEAMAYAHSKGVIHRDLKPSNIMVGKYGETYVMDWGLARVLGKQDHKDLRIQPLPTAPSTTVKSHRKGASRESPNSPLVTMDGDVVGTPAYMSPEQARGELDQIGPQSDVYALGTMLYHLLTGHMPYLLPGVVANQYAIWRWVQEGPPVPLHRAAPGAPPELAAICDKAMSRLLADRYADMEELAVDLRAFLENQVVAAYESGPIAELKKWVARNKGISLTAATAAVILAAVLWWSFDSIRSERNMALVEKERADANADRASRSAGELGRLSDVKILSDLKIEMKSLWPAHPEMVEPMRAWLSRAQGLLDRLPLHEQTLEDLRTRGTPAEHPRAPELAELQQTAIERERAIQEVTVEDERRSKRAALDRLRDQIASLEATLRREQPYEFEDEQLSWWHETLVGLVSGLVGLSEGDPFGETLVSVRKRLEFAETIHKYSIAYYQDEWDEAISSIADPAECPQYGGLELREQLGLVPMGRDPESGLWEFWQIQTGERPQRDEEGRITPSEGMGLVLVLIPGATFWMGAQPTDPEGPNFDPLAEKDESDREGNPVQVTLDAFFLSKYEMTQDQWVRITGEVVSDWLQIDPSGPAPLHPVDQVTFQASISVLKRLGLVLPTEAQWERACRAGTETPWYSGTEAASLAEHDNIADVSFGRTFNEAVLFEPFDDGLGSSAAVGSLKANGFGLFDMHGNAFEWCRDAYGSYDLPTTPGNGERQVQGESLLHVFRGGGYIIMAAYARSANRTKKPPDYGAIALGLRPARLVSR